MMTPPCVAGFGEAVRLVMTGGGAWVDGGWVGAGGSVGGASVGGATVGSG